MPFIKNSKGKQAKEEKLTSRNHIYYFAYGANMNFREMRKRCPGHEFSGRALLRDYQFCYDGKPRGRGGIYANVIPKKRGRVWGGLFRISSRQLKALDLYELYPRDYLRKYVWIKSAGTKSYRALIYYRIGMPKGRPSDAYRRIVLSGARDCALPPSYIARYLS